MDRTESILVTGAAGLVGSAVVDHLKSLGFVHVSAVPRRACDLMDRAMTTRLFGIIRPKYVFHAAARVYGIIGNMNHQGQSYLENTLINTNVIDAARLCRVKKITVMGTGAVYPVLWTNLPLAEDTIFDGRPHPSESGYAHAKRGMLAMLEAYRASYGLEWAYIVSCNLFGCRDKFDPINGHVVPSLMYKFRHAVRTGGNVVIWGDGSARRDFMYVKDAARAVHQIMERGNGIINMGSGEVARIRDIVDALAEITQIPTARIVWDAAQPNGQDYRAYDLTRLDACDFHCAYSIKEGLRETWDWYLRQ